MNIPQWIRRFRKDNPRWVVLLIDLIIVFICYILSHFVIYSFRGRFDYDLMMSKAPLVLLVYWAVFLIFKTYKSIVRQSGIRDVQRIMTTVFVVSAILLMLSFVLKQFIERETPWAAYLRLSYAVIFTHAMLTMVSLVASRIVYRWIYERLFWGARLEKVLLVGAGNMGNVTYNILHSDVKNKYRVVGFADDNPGRIGKRINGFKIMSLDDLNEDLIRTLRVDHIIIALDDNNRERIKNISSKIEPLPAKLKIMPSSAKLLSVEKASRQLRTLKIDDLLGREAIKLDNTHVQNFLKDKVVLVTGAAGSIGSELARQISFTHFNQLVLLDQAESALYDLQQELKDIAIEGVHYIVGNVRDRAFMETIFVKYRPDVVFHAAAYKHVPLMEQNPYESLRTNVLGTKNIADLATKYAIDKFVMVSTDKAVNPTNVMGATKRMAEMYVTALNSTTHTNFIVTRFGNVLGSNGSVIPLFEKQLKKGGPLTVTHPDITRYFMTIPEACQLVQEAGAMGKGGEIFVFDMGEPVKIMDLAKRMIRLKGYQYPRDIDIQVVGLRPGEKIYEELLANDENTSKTHHEKIMIAKVNTHDVHLKKERIDMLCRSLNDDFLILPALELVAYMKEIVPEYVSNNSIFEELDTDRMESAGNDIET